MYVYDVILVLPEPGTNIIGHFIDLPVCIVLQTPVARKLLYGSSPESSHGVATLRSLEEFINESWLSVNVRLALPNETGGH